MEPTDELIALKVLELKQTYGSQTELILAMKDVGFGNKRIADLLGTTPGTVAQAVNKAKKKSR